MGNWLSVTVLKLGKEVRITITVPCPECGGEIPLSWTGSPKQVYPAFPSTGACGSCHITHSLTAPEKTILRWWYLAKLELQEMEKEDQKRYACCLQANRSKKSERRKMKRQHVNAIRQQYYSVLLLDHRAS